MTQKILRKIFDRLKCSYIGVDSVGFKCILTVNSDKTYHQQMLHDWNTIGEYIIYEDSIDFIDLVEIAEKDIDGKRINHKKPQVKPELMNTDLDYIFQIVEHYNGAERDNISNIPFDLYELDNWYIQNLKEWRE